METEIVKAERGTLPGDALQRAGRIIRDGGLVVFPTETVYGLGASATDEKASAKVYAAKGRPSDNPLIIHIATPSDAEKYCYTTELYYKLAKAFMPGPLTVILKKKSVIPDTVTGGLDTVAVRCPSNEIARALILSAGVAIAAPSANISGKPSPTCAAHVINDMLGRVDMIIDGGECDIGLESTIVMACGDTLTMLRPGGITPEMLETVCKSVKLDSCITQKPERDIRPLAPGMKYRHYAPDCPVTLIMSNGEDGFEQRAEAFLADILKKDVKTGIMCSDECAGKLEGGYIYPTGDSKDMKTQAHRMFDALRYFDGIKVNRVYAVVYSTSGLGIAVYNRMLKASGYNVLKI